MRFAIAIVLMASSLASASDAEIHYYDINGETAQELRRELNSKGPIGKNGKNYSGHTSWHVSWKYKFSPSAGGCAFTRFEVFLTGTILLPRWTEGDRESSALATKWRNYMSALRRHEEGHYANGQKAADEIEALGRSFRVAGRCDSIRDAFKEQAHLIIEKYNRADAAYDAETHHGRTQGAKFP